MQQSPARIGFVATNSITQGEQVAQLWPILFERHKLEISFAHRTFAWGSDARGKAHVHVVIIGLAKWDDAPRQRRLFSYESVNGDPQQSQHTASLSPYLFDASGLTDPRGCCKGGIYVSRSMAYPKLIIGNSNLVDRWPLTILHRPTIRKIEFLSARTGIAVKSFSPIRQEAQ